MHSLSRLSVAVAAIGLAVTAAGTFMTSRGLPSGRSAWAIGGVVMLAGLLVFLGGQIHSRRASVSVNRPDSPFLSKSKPSLLVASSRLTAIVLVTLGILAIGVAAYQFVIAAWGWRPGLGVGVSSIAMGLMVLASGLALWLITDTAGHVDELLVYARRSQTHPERLRELGTGDEGQPNSKNNEGLPGPD